MMAEGRRRGGGGTGLGRGGGNVLGGDEAGLAGALDGNVAVAVTVAEHLELLAMVERKVRAVGLGGAEAVEEGALGIHDVGLTGMGAGAGGGGAAGL